ncbi:MAG TPA: hypothetical protein VK425_06435, partial [Acidimicrobiales bacterium]|nr:hypothetical protein [Acidimicrobiales bacterium]
MPLAPTDSREGGALAGTSSGAHVLADGTTAAPVWIGDAGRPAFGWFHSPSGDRCRGGAVICPPVGQDYIRAHYAIRLLAEQLAAAGFCALRFDYDGTGDSAGDDEGPERTASWLATVGQAMTALRAAGIPRLSLVGLRLGATLAAVAAAADGGADDVVLWDPYVSGRDFLREQALMSSAMFGTEPSGDGSVEVPGFWYGAVAAG